MAQAKGIAVRTVGDRGEGAVSYIAVVLMIVAVTVALVASSLGSTIAGGIAAGVCKVAGQECESETGANDRPAQPSLLPTPPPGGGDSGPPAYPSPQPGPAVRQPPEPPERAETEQVLRETPLGRAALDWLRRNGVRVVYRAGGGSYYDGDDNVIYIDTNQTPEERANTVVHEVNHAQHRGDPDPDDMGREEYIRRSIEEEARGVVQEIRNNQQLQDVRGPGEVPDHYMQAEYEHAYNAAIEAENRARDTNHHPRLTPEEARRVGERAGLQRIMDAFANGEIVTSTTGETYPDYYGKQWDDANDCFLWIFC